MKIQGIIHQQICQLKWHLLACFGLVMVLPIEEAVVNLKDGYGFSSSRMVILSVMFTPLLAGLIACANVQGDLNEKRYIFWQSKPANMKFLITLKFSIGFILSLIIFACPVFFGIVCSTLYSESMDKSAIGYFIPLPLMLVIMTYSLCFGCNVLVRSAARAWLVGMLLASFLLVLPFMLPLNYRDYISVFEVLNIYLASTLAVSVFAFVFSLFAAQHDWHLKTNLKGLLWVGAGLVFVLMMLFSSQVANIKVLQEKKIESRVWGRDSLDNAGDRILFQDQSYIDIDNNKISFSNINGSPDDIAIPITRMEGYYSKGYPRTGRLIKVVGDNLYLFDIDTYYRRERIEREEKRPKYKHIYEKVYLRSYKYTINSWTPVFELDLSNYLGDNSYPQVAMRLIDNEIIAFVDKSLVRIDVKDPTEFKLIDTKLDVLKRPMGYYQERRKENTIPLLPVEGIGTEDRIKLSIDWYYNFSYFKDDIYKSSIVDIHDGKIKFLLVHDMGIARYDVIRWDNENIYCKFITARPFTILEQMAGRLYYRCAVKNGKIYCWERDTLLVFDIRTGHRIRKLGHFVRMDYSIEDIEILDNGRILLCMQWEHDLGVTGPNRPSYERKRYLCLLENPE